MHGPAMTVNTATQFDLMWLGVMRNASVILQNATGIGNMVNRAVIWALVGLIHVSLWVDFVIWYISRIFMALVICLGPFLIICFLWRSTRGWAEQWIGKLVALTVLGFVSSILLRIIMVVMNHRTVVIQQLAATEGTINPDILITNMLGVTGVFWFGSLLMAIIPGAFSIGSGVGAGTAVASGALGRAAAVAAGGAGHLAGRLGAAASAARARRWAR